MRKILITLTLATVSLVSIGRTYSFKFRGGKSEQKRQGVYFRDVAKADSYLVVIGASSKKDSNEDMEIRAATLMKHIQSKKSVVNDVATLRCKPPEKERQKFIVTTGLATGTRDKATQIGGDMSSGYIKGGVIIEIWQQGKCLKHWSSATGPMAKTRLDNETKCAYISKSGYESDAESYDNATTIVKEED